MFSIVELTPELLFILKVLLHLWKHECKRVIADRFTSPDDVVWFDQTLADLAQKELGGDAGTAVDVGQDAYFVDFLRDAPEATGTTGTRHKNTRISQSSEDPNVLFWIVSEQGRNRMKPTSTCLKCTSPSFPLALWARD